MPIYAEERAKELQLLTRAALRELPEVCFDFINAIDATTQPLTRYAYVSDLKLFFGFLISELPKFADKTPRQLNADDLAKVTSRDIYMYLDFLGLYVKDDTEFSNQDLGKMRKLSSLRSFYKFMYKNGYIDSDPAALVDLPKRHQKPIIRLEPDEMARLLETVESGDGLSKKQRIYHQANAVRDTAIIMLFLGTGMRISELVGIDLDDLNFSSNEVRITRKGGNEEQIVFGQEVREALLNYLVYRNSVIPAEGHEKAFFLSMQKKRMSVRSVEVLVKKYASIAAPLKKISPHKLRSTYGTMLYRETGDIYLVADVLGHKDVNTTRKHYAAMSEDRRRLAAEVIKLRGDENGEPTPPPPDIPEE